MTTPQTYISILGHTQLENNNEMTTRFRVVQPVRRSYGMARHLKWRSLIEVLEV